MGLPTTIQKLLLQLVGNLMGGVEDGTAFAVVSQQWSKLILKHEKWVRDNNLNVTKTLNPNRAAPTDKKNLKKNKHKSDIRKNVCKRKTNCSVTEYPLNAWDLLSRIKERMNIDI